MTAADLSKRFETAAARDNLQDETFLSLLQKLPSNAKTLLLRLSSPEYLSMSTTTMDLSPSALAAKQDAIRSCLLGDEQGRVNLWLLRELALSKGGLLTPEFRKLAWPKLVGAHVAIASNKNPSLVTPSASCLTALRIGVSQTTWNVQECIRALRDHQTTTDRNMVLRMTALTRSAKDSRMPVVTSSSNKLVRFAHDQDSAWASPLHPKHLYVADDADEDRSDSKASTPPRALDLSPANSTTSVSDSESNVSEEIKPVLVLDMRQDTFVSPLASVTHTNKETTTKKTFPSYRKPSSLAQQMSLYKIIQQLLSTAPSDEATNGWYFQADQDYYHYASSLPELASLLWIHLQSLSLTTVVLQQLAAFQLRDALRGVDDLEASVAQLTIVALLERFDPDLHGLFSNGSTKEVVGDFGRQFVSGSWLTGLDLPVAARLMDAFIVAHATFPLYVCATLLMEHGEVCMAAMQEYLTSMGKENASIDESHDSFCKEQFSAALNLLIHDGLGSVEAAEEVIQKSIAHMQVLPPIELASLASRCDEREERMNIMLASAYTFLQPPEWMKSFLAPSDFVHAQSTHEHGEEAQLDLDPVAGVASIVVGLLRNEYPRARAALGQPDRYCTIRKMLLVSILAAAAMAMLILAMPRNPLSETVSASIPGLIPNKREQLLLEPMDAVAPVAVIWANFTSDVMSLRRPYNAGTPSAGICWASEITFRDVVWKPATTIAAESVAEETRFQQETLYRMPKHLAFVNQIHAKRIDLVNKLKQHALSSGIVSKITEGTLNKLKKYEPELALVHAKCFEVPGAVKRELIDLWAWAEPLSDLEWMDCV